MGHSLASFNKGRAAESQASVAVEEGRIARIHGPGLLCHIANDNYHHRTDEGDGTGNWLRVGTLVQILAWIFLGKLPMLHKPQFP